MGLSQRTVAKRAGFAQSRLSKFERGAGSLSYKHLCALARALNCERSVTEAVVKALGD